ncbi:protein kinase [Ktedonobacteria bacterium brp13]|nr:protein kinase [Ktedonobacteria bacterium brp13]
MDYNTHGSQGSTTTFCLGHPAHPLQPGETICHICGALATGMVLGAYQVQRTLGMGRSGYAYLALHQRSGQPVTIKLFPSDNTTTPLWEAGRRDVRVATALRHPSISPVFSCTNWTPGMNSTGTSGTFHSQPNQQDSYLLTLCQYIPGNMNQFIAHYQHAEAQQALRDGGSNLLLLLTKVIQQAGSALSAAHKRGLVHGALTPGNLLFSSQERAWIADFGLARLHPPTAPYLPPELYNASQASLQMGNAGAYWHAANPASDQYMFAMLCQQLFAQLLLQQTYELFLPVLQRATHQKPERRYPSIDLLVADIQTLAQHTTGGVGQAITHPNNHITGSRPMLPSSPVYPETARSRGGSSQSQPNIYNPSTPLPVMDGGPLTPVMPATPMTPASPLAPDDWEKRGDKLFTLHQYDGALQAYHRALEVDWNKENVWMALGDTYFALERYKESLMAYEQAMNINPHDPASWINRGTALDALGRHREANDCYERAEQLRPA